MSRVKRSNRDLSGDWNVGVRCWIARKGKVVLGAGRADLLDCIGRTQSIRAAARELNMSYRRAWMLVQSINRGAGEPLIATATGGKQGGGAILTARGRELVALYRKICDDLQNVVVSACEPALATKTANSQSSANSGSQRRRTRMSAKR